jgi:DNA-binding response OmpR family regulator
MFIEDDAALASVVVRHLGARGHDARSAGSAEEALEVITGGFRPTVVLLDINLPGASGWDLLRSAGLRAAAEAAVYIVSATSIPPARLREFKVAGFLPKPFAVSTLVEIVERHSGEAEADASATAQGGLDAL